ncbi:hypothetical protein B0T19DRAFT_442106 [Cercophora scortea]|uniref:Protein kinase domain-containing protein n=1 Tax=Cercophora scortea TaxID=314031 RepID=A0AAE0MDG6_9PEZI|nr:hypothetical protein B0T19DRAFT_442106 [Cercophora scortea]
MASPTGYQIRCDRDPQGGRNREYRYIRPLGHGAQSKAELALDTATNQVVVRKTPVEADVINVSDVPPESWEIKVLDYLDGFDLSRTRLTPRWAQCVEFKSAIVRKPGAEQGQYWPVTYWEFCNGSGMNDLLDDSAPPVPVTLLARCVAQVCETLEVMYQAGPKPVWHFDLHEGNIWLNWTTTSTLPDFIIGDFGYSQIGKESGDDEDILAPNDVLQFRQCVRMLLDNLERVGLDVRTSAIMSQDARPPTLVGVINAAKHLASVAQAVEGGTDEFNGYVSWARQRLLPGHSLKPLTLWNPPSRVDKAEQLKELAEHLVNGPCTMVPVYIMDD